MKRKQIDANNIIAKRFKHTKKDELYDKKLNQYTDLVIVADNKFNQNDLNKTNQLNKHIIDYEDKNETNLVEKFSNQPKTNSIDLLKILLDNYKKTNSLNKINNLSEILIKLIDLRLQFCILLDTKVENTTIDIKNLSQNDLKYLDEIHLSNLNLPIYKRFNFYLIHIRLEISKSFNSISHLSKRKYDSNGNLKPIRCKNSEKKLIIQSWYDPNDKVSLSNNVKVSFKCFNQVISHQHNSVDINLENEHNWHNCYKNENIYENESNIDVQTNYHRYVLFVVPKQNEFDLFLSIDYKYGIDYLYSTRTINQYLLKNLKDLLNCLLRMQYMNKVSINEDYICKIFDLLESVNEIFLIKQFISLLVKNYSEQIIKKIINLFSKFVWKELQSSIIESLKPVDFDNISNICTLSKVLMNENFDVLGETCVNELVFPFLSQRDKFIKSLDQNPQKILRVLYKIAETLVLFENSDDYFISYKILINQMSPNFLKQLIDEFIKNIDQFKNSKSVFDLVKLRLEWLVKALKKVPEFSWVMEGKINGHPVVENFLRSNQQELIYSKKLVNLKQARDFASRYNGLKRGFSINIQIPNEQKSKACQFVVIITKTREFYQNQVNLYSNLQSELKLIECKLKLFLV